MCPRRLRWAALLVDAVRVAGERTGQAGRMLTKDEPRHRLAGPTAVGSVNTRAVAVVALVLALLVLVALLAR